MQFPESWLRAFCNPPISTAVLAEMTMTDPVFYTAPVKLTKRWAEVPNGRVLPYECPEEMWNDHLAKLANEAGVPVP